CHDSCGGLVVELPVRLGALPSGQAAASIVPRSYPVSCMSLQFRQAVADWAAGLRLYPLWITLAWREILQRYRRSTVGPFWIAFSTAVMVGALGLLYGTLFKMDLTEYLPFLAVGLVLWNLFTMLVNEGCTTFVSAAGYLKQVALPKSVFVFQMATRNLIVFAHNALIIVIVMLWFGVKP